MDSAEEVKTRLDIADLIGEYLSLKPAGSNAFKALCPFHHEKTPSFYVSRARQSWHCFGCATGGDHFTFLEKIEGMEFREALEHLAQKVGIVLPKFDGEKMGERKRLMEVNGLAARFFSSILNQFPEAEGARTYLKKRGVDELTSDLFKLGYAPVEWSRLSDALREKGVTDDELVRAGLAVRNERGGLPAGRHGIYDRFRGRLMFPITDVHGNIVGFTGRVLETGDKGQETRREAKYVNTPETAVYRKSAVLYGLDKAKGEIRAHDLAIIVEGNMDVIASHQFGILHVIAASGTALTVEQLALIKRFTSNVAIAFDEDAAGHSATLRGLDLARAQDFSIKIITLPPEAGKDPDEAVRKNPELWRDAIKNAVGIMEWVYRQAFKAHPSHEPEGKKMIARQILPEIQRIADPVERDHWRRRLARDLDVGEEALREAAKRETGAISSVRQERERANRESTRKELPNREREIEKRLLSLLLLDKGLARFADELGLADGDFADPELAALYARVRQEYPVDKLSSEPLINMLALQAEQEWSGTSLVARKQEFIRCLELMRQERRLTTRKHLEQQMREAERVGDADKIAELLEQFEQLKT